MRRVLYLFVLLGVVVSCMERPQPLVYHPKLVQIDSLLQHDSLKWKNLNRGEVMEDVYLYEGKPFKSDTTPGAGTYNYDGSTKTYYPVQELLTPWNDGFKERGVLTKACQPMFLLKHFPQDSLITEANRMYYSLLKTETLVKDFVSRKGMMHGQSAKHYLGSDSLFRKVVAYYDALNDKAMQARAHALLAFYQRTSSRVDEVRELLIAARYAQEVGNEELLAFIYRFLGHTYFWGDAYQKADSIYALAEPLAIAQKDTMLWMESIKFRLEMEIKMGLRAAWRMDEGHSRALQRMYQGLDLAQKYKAHKYEADFAYLLGEEYLDKEQCNEAYLEKALHFAKRAESLYDNGNNYKLLAKVYAEMEYFDSTAFYLAKIYGNDWQQTGPSDLYVKVVFPSKNEDVAAVETELQKEWQKEEYEGFLLRNKYVLAGVVLIGVLIVMLLHGYHRHRYRIQSERLNQQLHKSRLLHTFLQEGLKEREAEILRLQEELNRHCLDESTKRDLTEELNVANENRHILAMEAMKQSPAYNKIQLIMNDFRWKEESDYRLDEKDWLELMNSVDACYNKVLARLSGQYRLDERELHICCLSLVDVPVVHIAHLIGYTRPVVYKAEQKILQKMGYSYEKGYLRKLLKAI